MTRLFSAVGGGSNDAFDYTEPFFYEASEFDEWPTGFDSYKASSDGSHDAFVQWNWSGAKLLADSLVCRTYDLYQPITFLKFDSGSNDYILQGIYGGSILLGRRGSADADLVTTPDGILPLDAYRRIRLAVDGGTGQWSLQVLTYGGDLLFNAEGVDTETTSSFTNVKFGILTHPPQQLDYRYNNLTADQASISVAGHAAVAEVAATAVVIRPAAATAAGSFDSVAAVTPDWRDEPPLPGAGVVAALATACSTVYRANTAEGGTHGTNVNTSNSGGDSGQAFDAVVGSYLTYSNLSASAGNLGFLSTPALYASEYVQWSWTNPDARLGGDFRLGAMPSGKAGLLSVVGSPYTYAVYVYPDGSVRMLVGGSITVAASSAGLVTHSTWYRILMSHHGTSGIYSVSVRTLDGTVLWSASGTNSSYRPSTYSSARFGLPYGGETATGTNYEWDNIKISTIDAGIVQAATGGPAATGSATAASKAVRKTTVGTGGQYTGTVAPVYSARSAATAAGTGGVTADAVASRTGAGTVAGTAAVGAEGDAAHPGDTVVAGVAGVTASPGALRQSPAGTGGTGGVAAAATKMYRPSAAPMPGAAGASVEPSVAHIGPGPAAGTAGVAADAVAAHPASSTMTFATYISAEATIGLPPSIGTTVGVAAVVGDGEVYPYTAADGTAVATAGVAADGVLYGFVAAGGSAAATAGVAADAVAYHPAVGIAAGTAVAAALAGVPYHSATATVVQEAYADAEVPPPITEAADVAGTAWVGAAPSATTYHVTCTTAAVAGASVTATSIDFPAALPAAKVEFLIDGGWFDATPYVLVADQLTRTMWRSGEAMSTDPSSFRFKLISQGGLFNFRNRSSALWRENGWRGVLCRATVEGFPWFYGPVESLSTEFDGDGLEFASVSVSGALASPYRNPAPSDPAGDAVLAAPQSPRFYWPLTGSEGVTRFEAGVPWHGPMAIAGAVPYQKTSVASNVGTVDGPCGTQLRYTNLLVETNKSNPDGTVRIGKGDNVVQMKPVARWVDRTQRYWDSTGMAVDFVIRVKDGRVEYDDTYLPQVDSGLYPPEDQWESSTAYSKFGSSGAYGRTPPGLIAQIQMADGRSYQIMLSERASYNGNDSDPKQKCAQGNYVAWSFCVEYGSTAGATNLVPLLGDPAFSGVARWFSRPVQNMLFDGNWHHVRCGLDVAPSHPVWTFDIDGMRIHTLQDDAQMGYGGEEYPPGLPKSRRPVGVTIAQMDSTYLQFESLAIGQLAIYDGLDWPTSVQRVAPGFPGELAHERIRRTLAYQNAQWVEGLPSSVPLGSQTDWSPQGVVQAAEVDSFGRVLELPAGGVTFEPIEARYQQSGFMFDLDATDIGEPPTLPGPSSSVLGEVTASLSGSLFGVPPSVTVPGYPGNPRTTATAGVASPARLFAWASAKALWLNPVEDSNVTLVLDFAARPGLIGRWLSATQAPPITVRVSGIPGLTEPAELFVDGFTEAIGSFEWTVALSCTPARPYRAGWIESGTRVTVLDIDAVVAAAYPAGATAIDVVSPALPQISEATTPFAIEVRGEEMTVADVDTAVSVMRAPGAAVGGFVPVTAPFPASVATGDILLAMVAYGAPGGLPEVPDGWFVLGEEVSGGVSVQLLSRRYAVGLGSSVDFANSAGVDLVVQVGALSGAAEIALASDQATNDRATNVSTPTAEFGFTAGEHVTVLIAARNGDSASSSVGPSSLTAGGAGYALGTSMWWGYGDTRAGIERALRAVAFDAGAGAGACLAVAVAANVQTLTVARSVNDVERELVGLERVSMKNCPVIPL